MYLDSRYGEQINLSMLQKSSPDDIGDDDDGVSANVRNLVSLFEKRRKSTKSTDQSPRPDDEDAKCENVIISPPLEFVDSLTSASVTVSSKPRSRTDFISDILKLGGGGGGEEAGPGAGEGEGDPVNKMTQQLYTTLLSQLVAYRERLTCLSSEYEQLSLHLRELDHKLMGRAPYHVVDKFRVHLADTDKIVRLVLR